MISELPFNSSQPELEKILDGVVRAGERRFSRFMNTDFTTNKKDDDSPITQADV